MDVNTISQRSLARNVLDNVYAMSIVLEGEMYSAEMQAAVGNNYKKLQSVFNNFQNLLKTVANKKSVC